MPLFGGARAGQMSLLNMRDARLTAYEVAELAAMWPSLDEELEGLEWL